VTRTFSAEFYTRANCVAPHEAIPGDGVPEPKSLLVHSNDMTLTLEGFHKLKLS
jgi:hypothetical protein